MTEMELTSEMERGSSPASRGAAGAYIEGELGALYLLALLTGNRAPGMPDARVVSVRFQGIEHGFKLDDLIVFGGGAAGDSILEIQSKRDITFSPGMAFIRTSPSRSRGAWWVPFRRNDTFSESRRSEQAARFPVLIRMFSNGRGQWRVRQLS
ncbi:hypothetical protein [Pseudomonas sp. VD9]|uniref:hypothetical protein n=1 Tax=Pseudomonas sp. VD9 TaxID=3342076 RepID=UPI003C6CA9F2